MLRWGFAKALFTQVYQRSPWLVSEKECEPSPWPLLDLLLAQHRLSDLDYLLAHRLLRCYPHVGQEVALFICHLVLAAKGGHLCVCVMEGELMPSVMQLWQDEEGQPLSVGEAQRFTQLILEGVQKIPPGLVTKTALNPFSSPIPYTPICCEGDRYYLQRHWMFESLFLRFLRRHLETPPALALEPRLIECVVDRLYQGGILMEEQAEAIIQSCLNALTLIIGGPGTGKTYTVSYLIQVFWELLSEEQRQSYQIVLAAPTGKAAANLQCSLSKVAATLEGFPSIQAKTLHALLGIKQGVDQARPIRLSADLIIVDESSMIDIRMMAYLFESLKQGSRLILLGDPHQLPSVEAGSVFMDLIEWQKSYSDGLISCIQLATCVRAELRSLIDFARCIHQGRAQEVLMCLAQTNGGVGIRRLHLAADKKEAQREFLAYALGYFPTVIASNQRAEYLLELFHAIRLLSPIRQGPFGVEVLNQMIWQRVSQTESSSGWLAIPIIIVMNDYRQELFNGETGVLMRRLPLQSLGVEDYALFPSRQVDGQARCLPALLLPKYEYAYCLSVHKSQGSEFDHVILVLPEGAELLGREVFYTAVTRARKQIEIYGSDAIIFKTVMQQGIRLSGIQQRLALERI